MEDPIVSTDGDTLADGFDRAGRLLLVGVIFRRRLRFVNVSQLAAVFCQFIGAFSAVELKVFSTCLRRVHFFVRGIRQIG